MGLRSDIYTPEQVERGMRDYIAWETRHSPKDVAVTTIGRGVRQVYVLLDSKVVTDKEKLERDLRDMLPNGYLLKLTWSN